MNKFLFKTFISDWENVKNPEVRKNYGKLAGIAGIISNALLCLIKILTGILSGSIAIVADGINNLADASSSVITLLGFRLASMPEDKEHPYGHARIEYITGLVVSIIIMVVGFELGKGSVDKIINPQSPEFSLAVLLVLIISIGVKVWQSLFNIAAGKKINSSALIATGADSRNDVISTSAVLVSLIAGHYFDLQIDGIMGLLVSLFIIWSGISLVKETISPLLGEAPDGELVTAIEDITMSFDGVIGIHDLIVHNYGPGKVFASLHIEVDAAVDVMVSHELVDDIERRLKEILGIFVTAHMDPVDLANPYREAVSNIISKTIKLLDGVASFHDLRMITGPTRTNVVFDLVVSPDCNLCKDEVESLIDRKLQEYNPTFHSVIDYDISYLANN
ncbi:MAG: cation transporter [Firmicutes bacterium]|nr:cation transporter [Bacillota bacterium]